MSAKFLALILLLFLSFSPSAPREVKIGVLGLFHPTELFITASGPAAIVVTAGTASCILAPNSPNSIATLKQSAATIEITCNAQISRATQLTATTRTNADADFNLTVPGKISRHYQGKLRLTVENGELIPVITMPLETAVASIVAAESAPGAPLETLKSQAVVTRSYLIAGKGRHHNFDFCDLTHCQFLRDPPAQNSPAANAAQSTRGLILEYQGKPIATMFARSCSGHTRTLADIKMSATEKNPYPYYAVLCDADTQNPVRWQRLLPAEDATRVAATGERGRLAINRQQGWQTIPSNNFEITPASTASQNLATLNGIGEGHGVGLCQRGAQALAAGGATFREILNHYFPNTEIRALP